MIDSLSRSLACWAVSSFAETGHTSMPLMLANIVLFNAGSASIKIVITGNRHIPDHYSTIQVGRVAAFDTQVY